MQPLRSGALASLPLRPSLTSTVAAEQLDARLRPGNEPTSQIFLLRDRKRVTAAASSGDAGDDVDSDEALMSASVSSFRCSAAPSAHSVAEVGTHPAMSAEGSAPLPSAAQPKEPFLLDHPPPQRHRRQWTPRRGSLCSGTPVGGNGGAVESAVTTVRDWVRSAGCSPSKEPRSASISRRDSLASSFASALVPRDGRWELPRQWTTGADDDDGEERERRAGLGARAAKACSSSSGGSAVNSGRGWDGVDSWSSSEAQLQRPEGFELACAPTSHQRTPSWRQLHSHPATTATITSSNSSVPASRGNGDGAAAPACSSAYTFSAHSRSGHSTGTSSLAGGSSASAATDCGTAATLLSGWGPNRRGGDGDDGSYGDQPSLSGVSSPSLVTPPPSRRTSAPVASTLQANTRMLSPSPVLTARELAQLGEWRSVAEAQRSDLVSTAAPTVLSPLLQRPAPERPDSGGPASWCLESLSCASFNTSLPNGLWSGRDSTAQTPLNWERGGAAVGTGGAHGSSRASPACWSTSEPAAGGDSALLECRSGGWCSRISSPMSVSLADMNGPACAQQGMPHCSPLTSPPTSPSFAHRVRGTARGCGSDGDDSTMEDIEMRHTKRKCVESPRGSPSATPLSGSFALSLADALAAAPTCMTTSLETHLWQQQQRRRRTVSPSVARPDEEPLPCDGADTYASTHYRDRSTFSPPSPIRTTAPSMVPVHPPPSLDISISSSLLATGAQGRPHDMSGGSLHITVDAAAAVLETADSITGVVVEVDAQHAASLSSCGSGGSGEEPEVDTFSLERAQAAMEDADAEAASALRARQHRLYLLSTSQFAQDVERHGGHVDPMQLEMEAEAESEEAEQEWRREGCARRPATSEGFPGNSCGISAGLRGGRATRLRWEKDDGPRSRPNGIAANEEGEVSSAPTAACIPHLHSPHPPRPSFSTVPCATPSAHPAAPVASGRVGSQESFATPLRRGACVSATAAHVRWGEPEESEDGHSPGSVATTTGSRSRRDMSPPVRERSMAPAELQKEREGY
ncbi:hypothetical protein LdCL_170011100 [Leishmania donovani]|uniref:Uncharacterized protein n=1 Tax=Leishmania donovani TaxID=5661 RepID=A0A3Q8IAU9_LEIDO|nr:hypothetical protein LdCL_170011100 [Leishmania donovani]